MCRDDGASWPRAATLATTLGAAAMVALALTGCGGGVLEEPAPPAGQAVAVEVRPGVATVAPGGAQPFAALVTGSADTAVTWSVREGAAGGTVSAGGLYAAPATANAYHVVATSVADPAVSGTATVTVAAPTCTGTPVRFAVIGDFGFAGPGGGEAAVASLVKAWNPEFVVTVGDNNYEFGEASTIDANIGQFYAAFIAPYRGSYGPGATVNAFFPSLGNHDWLNPAAGGATNCQPYLDYFTGLPGNRRYYDFVKGPVHFFALDSDSHEPDGISSTSTQGKWLQAGLAASTARFKVVYLHHAPFSSGSTHGSTTASQWPYAAWGASAVLAGHEHNYERLAVDGIPYFVNGLGGDFTYAFGRALATSQVRFNAAYGAQLVEADASHMTFQFIRLGGTVVDTFTVTNLAPCP